MRTRSHIGLEISQKKQARRCWHCPPRMPASRHLLPHSDSSRRLRGARDEREECARNINGLLSVKEIQQWVWREEDSQETWKKKKKAICRLYFQKICIPFIQWRKENFESRPDWFRPCQIKFACHFYFILDRVYTSQRSSVSLTDAYVTPLGCSPHFRSC